MEYIPSDEELEEKEITLKSGQFVEIDDITEIDYIGKNNQVTLHIAFNPCVSEYYNEYSHMYETYPDSENQIFLTPTIEEDYIDFPDECKGLDDEIDVIIQIDNWHIELPDFGHIFPSMKFGNYYGRPYTLNYVKVDKNIVYEDEWDIDGVIFARVKKTEWISVINKKLKQK
jgi:hypothetical protein